jgi:cold shock CspA family protein
MSMIIEGKLRFWNYEKGYGFADAVLDGNITRPVFLHAKKIKVGTPVKDARVFFRAVEMPRGLMGLDIIIFPPSAEEASAGGL